MKNKKLIIQIHQVLLLVLLIFTFFAKEDVKRIFWLMIGAIVISMLVQVFVFMSNPEFYGDYRNKLNKQRNKA